MSAVGTTLDLPQLPSLVVGRVEHLRRTPVRHAFGNRHYQWLVDVDDLPQRSRPLSWLVRFDAADHLAGGRHGGIRADLARVLGDDGIVLGADDRVVMLAHARVLGHVFDPLSVFWVIAPDGGVRATVFEVHNTYGGRHTYVLDVDDSGHATTDKAFTVSPFNDRTGRYEIRVHLDTEVLAIGVALHRGDVRVFSASVIGKVRPATDREVVRTALRHLPMTWWVSALIRLHGVRLWLRRLPLHPVPDTDQEILR